MKITALLLEYIDSQRDLNDLAKRWNVSVQTIYNFKNENYKPSAELIASILNDTGLEFEKAFEI